MFKMNPLPLDQIISQVNNFGQNLDSLENKISRQNDAQKLVKHLEQRPIIMSARPQFSNGGGVDSQSLETVLELHNLAGTDG
jgi:hypothetical protein